jgi:hypothetical protein
METSKRAEKEPGPTNKRKAERRVVQHDGMVYAESGKPLVPCSLRDVSAAGAQIELKKEIELPPQFILSLSPRAEVRRRCVLVWQFLIVAGVKFIKE